MKIGGKKYSCAHEVIISIPRGSSPKEAANFVAHAVLDYSEFDRLVPLPKKRVRVTPNGEESDIEDDVAYIAASGKRRELDLDYMCIKSLAATPGIEWDTVKINEPNTWANWRVDLQKSGFSRVEINRIFGGVCQANALDEDFVKAARDSFLLSRAAETQPVA